MKRARQCEACGSPLAGDQHYCLVCGTRAGARSALFEDLLARIRANHGERDGAEAGSDAGAATESAPAPAAARGLPRLPGPWVSALLVLAFVGFGALLGDAGAGAGPGRLAAANQALKVVVPAQAAGTAPRPTASEPPAAQTQETPGPAANTSEGSSGATTSSEPSAPSGGSPTSKGGEPASTPPAKHPAASGRAATLKDIEHVFVIVLDDEPYAADFGPEGKAAYLARTLESKGELLLRYDAIAHEQLPNGIALLSGQGPTAQTAANCPSYTPLTPATVSASEQVLGDGCVYPPAVQTLPGQLVAKHLTWRAYVEGLDEGAGTPPACMHPASGAADPTYAAGAYAGYRNPFVYFQSIVSSPNCVADDAGLARLDSDLRSAASTPSFSYIVPNRCHDGGAVACAPGAAAGAGDSVPVLRRIVPEIMASQAYRRGGLIVITADEAPSSGEFADSSSCCGQPSYPNLTTTGFSHGGGVVGALLLSPFVKGGTTSQEPYNHYSLLRTIEDVFGLGHIGYAALPAVKSFSASLLDEPVKKG